MTYQIWIDSKEKVFLCKEGEIAIFDLCKNKSIKNEKVYNFIQNKEIKEIHVSSRLNQDRDKVIKNIKCIQNLSHFNLENINVLQDDSINHSLYRIELK